jgi:TldD protein
VLIDGFWGFAASNFWTRDEAVRLARNAVTQAKAYRWGAPRDLGWEAPVTPATGEWSTPIKRDAAEVHPDEIADYKAAMASDFARRFPGGICAINETFMRREQLYLSTEGADTMQRLYTVLGTAKVQVTQPTRLGGRTVVAPSNLLTGTSGSYDYFTSLPFLEDEFPRLYEQAMRQPAPQPVTVGRYPILFDAATMGAIVGQTVGVASEIDRIRGYEANAGGTSYLGPLDTTIGRQLAPESVSIQGDRNAPLGVATVGWDDDGVVPTPFDIVRNGRVVDLPTSREHVLALDAAAHRTGPPRTSHGCAYAQSGRCIPIVCTPNLTLTPAATDITFEQLAAHVGDGIAVFGGDVHTDQQQLTAQINGGLWRIKNGKLDAPLSGGAVLIRSPEFWRNLRALGGASSALRSSWGDVKGEPAQGTGYSVTAVPVVVDQLAVIDVSAIASPIIPTTR